MPKREIERKEVHSRLLKSYGSWLYCTGCNKTVAYICYTTYKWITINFDCKCGTKGGIELKEKGSKIPKSNSSSKVLSLKNNRYICSNDDEPLFSIVSKQINSVEYNVSCLKCKSEYYGKIQTNST